jgi:hypothetical protein
MAGMSKKAREKPQLTLLVQRRSLHEQPLEFEAEIFFI